MSGSKGYTIAFFIREINSKVKSSNSTSVIVNTISPTYGVASVKLGTLSDFIGSFNNVANGVGKYAGFGKTPKTRLLKALKLRKKNGFAA